MCLVPSCSLCAFYSFWWYVFIGRPFTLPALPRKELSTVSAKVNSATCNVISTEKLGCCRHSRTDMGSNTSGRRHILHNRLLEDLMTECITAAAFNLLPLGIVVGDRKLTCVEKFHSRTWVGRISRVRERCSFKATVGWNGDCSPLQARRSPVSPIWLVQCNSNWIMSL